MDAKSRRWAAIVIGAVVACHLIVLLAAPRLVPITCDTPTFHAWVTMAHQRGLTAAYDWDSKEVAERFGAGTFNVNYPPLFFYLYYPLALPLFWLGVWPSCPSAAASAFFRAPLCAVQLLLFLAIYRLLNRRGETSRAIWTGVLVGLNPLVLLVGPVFGQFEFVLLGLMVLSLELQSRRRFIPAGVLAALAALVKPQFLLFVPIIALVAVRGRSWRDALRWLAPFLVSLATLTSPFLLHSGLRCLQNGYARVHEAHLPLTREAFNAWWLVPAHYHLDSDSKIFLGATPKTIGFFALGVASLLLAACYLSGRERSPLAGLLPIYLMSCFLLLSAMTNGAVILGAVSLCIWGISDRNVRAPAILAAGLATLNVLSHVLLTATAKWHSWLAFPDPAAAARGVAILQAAVYLGFLVYFVYTIIRPATGGNRTVVGGEQR